MCTTLVLRNAWFPAKFIYKGVYMFHLLSIVGVLITISENFTGSRFGRDYRVGKGTAGKAAGLRTHILVCVGVTLMMVVSEHIFEKYKTFAADSIIRVDPARIAAQVVTGIGFLGAGTIMRMRTTVRGFDNRRFFMGCGRYWFGGWKQLLLTSSLYNTAGHFCVSVVTSV